MTYESSKADKAKDKKFNSKEGSKRDVDVAGQKRSKPVGSIQNMKANMDTPIKKLARGMKGAKK